VAIQQVRAAGTKGPGRAAVRELGKAAVRELGRAAAAGAQAREGATRLVMGVGARVAAGRGVHWGVYWAGAALAKGVQALCRAHAGALRQQASSRRISKGATSISRQQ
jgi:hypothetical protein